MKIAVTVQTHPARLEMAEALAARIGDAGLAIDPDPLAYRSPWRTYRLALEQQRDSDNGATHLLVIQDDAEICMNFRPGLARIVSKRPEDLLVLFVGGAPHNARDAVWEACARDETFAVYPVAQWVPAIAVIWPTAVIPAALDWVDEQRWPVKFSADDEIIGRIRTQLGLTVTATVPCLVEHPDVVESIVGKRRAMAGRNLDRVSCCFHPDNDPLEIWA